MPDHPTPSSPRAWGAFEPLRERLFRRIWASSLLSNFGTMILGVGAAWDMTRITASPRMVALVQTALMLPMMLVSVPAGAVADMFDRRKVALVGLGFACLAAAAMTLVALAGATTPWLLLAFCALIGTGGAVFSPAWQASVREQVSREQLPAAVALTSISYNIARSFGPALGGAIVLVAGARAAFAANAVCYLPLIVAFAGWRGVQVSSRLPPERIDRAIVAGARYARHSAPIRAVMLRALIAGIAGASVSALMPIVARDVLGGGAGTYGLLLGFYGGGAVVGAMLIGRARERMEPEAALRLVTLVTGASVIVIGFSRSIVLTLVALTVSGAAWMLLAAMLNLGVQLSAPRWVTARALSWFQSCLTGGVAIGAWLWGWAASGHGVPAALVASGAVLMLTAALGLVLPVPRGVAADVETVELPNEPEVALALTPLSGPIVIEIDYRVDPSLARSFYGVMLAMQSARQRNGASDWSLARDIARPEMWTERYHCLTWGDYQRQRTRLTQSDLALYERASVYRAPGSALHVRRLLERPFGSVRWRDDVPDAGNQPIVLYAP